VRVGISTASRTAFRYKSGECGVASPAPRTLLHERPALTVDMPEFACRVLRRTKITMRLRSSDALELASSGSS
jgi:hypothetical protein